MPTNRCVRTMYVDVTLLEGFDIRFIWHLAFVFLAKRYSIWIWLLSLTATPISANVLCLRVTYHLPARQKYKLCFFKLKFCNPLFIWTVPFRTSSRLRLSFLGNNIRNTTSTSRFLTMIIVLFSDGMRALWTGKLGEQAKGKFNVFESFQWDAAHRQQHLIRPALLVRFINKPRGYIPSSTTTYSWMKGSWDSCSNGGKMPTTLHIY